MKNPGEVRARTCGTKSPSWSEALRFIDSSKFPSTKKWWILGTGLMHFAEPAIWPSSIRTEDPTCANHVDMLTLRSVFPSNVHINILRGLPCQLEKAAPKIHQWTIYFCRWGFGWVDKAQCFRSARRFGATGSSLDFSRVFHDMALLGLCLETFFQCTILSYPGQPPPLTKWYIQTRLCCICA